MQDFAKLRPILEFMSTLITAFATLISLSTPAKLDPNSEMFFNITTSKSKYKPPYLYKLKRIIII